MERVVDDSRLRTVRLAFKLVGRCHVDRDGLNTLGNTLGEWLKECSGDFAGEAIPPAQLDIRSSNPAFSVLCDPAICPPNTVLIGVRLSITRKTSAVFHDEPFLV